jgi:hypothetical protein
MTALNETKIRLVWSVDAMANAKGITNAHRKNHLINHACTLLDSGETALKALEAARLEATQLLTIQTANAAFDQLLEQIQTRRTLH